jgi:hypothetical protein
LEELEQLKRNVQCFDPEAESNEKLVQLLIEMPKWHIHPGFNEQYAIAVEKVKGEIMARLEHLDSILSDAEDRKMD